MKKRMGLLCAAFCAAALGAQPVTVKIASVAPNRSPWDIEQRKLAQEWAKITDNAVSVQFFDAAALGGEEDVIQKLRAVRPGQKPPLDGAVFTNIGLHIIAPETKVMTFIAPFLFKNQEEVDFVFKKNSAMFEKALKDQGYELLGWFSVGWIYFMTKEEVRTPEALKQVRLAMGGIASADITNTFKMAGFKTENVASDKLPQSIKSPSGVQGVYTIPMYGYATKFYESLPYILDVPICPIFTCFIISEKTWAQIPARNKEQLIAAVARAEQVFIDVQKKTDRDNLLLMQKQGAKLIEPTAAELARWEEVFAADINRVAESGKSVIDARLLAETRRVLADYRAGRTQP